ncbi:uncharacterized protein PV09_09074 [Verruconis gallopava]|uniref:Dicer-like protein 1 n=1 Tax=Verruconis gallopava TaxID=253628 RepID=A0A0D1XAI8_9PEZI|nr:uncharacterized protein PV09_09074 [Verruconis gallopava]KIV99210.1 hypothetical protein PV09_09074 [Verruconis gallopava]
MAAFQIITSVMGNYVPDLVSADAVQSSEGKFSACDMLFKSGDVQKIDDTDDESVGEADQTSNAIDSTRQFRLLQQELFKDKVLERAADIDYEQSERRKQKLTIGDGGSSVGDSTVQPCKFALNDPREYQLELYERAKKENTIAVLETGSGKTFIAILLIRHMLDQELEDRAKGYAHRTTIFMAPTNTLVYQQTAVLMTNIDQNIASRCGDMNAKNLLERAAWEKCLAENMIIVCTPTILHQCLGHALIKMEQINLLVFDEVHHAKKDHPYAKIVEEFYKSPHNRSLERRPRVFGMTASPIDAKSNPTLAALELERLLDSKIATFRLSPQFRNKAEEIVLWFQTLQDPFKSPLHLQIEQHLCHIPAYKRLLRISQNFSSELGHWAADKFWEITLRESEKNVAEAHLYMTWEKYTDHGIEITDTQLKALRRAFDVVRGHHFGLPEVRSPDLSSKVLELHRFLIDHYEGYSKVRCLVFVEQRATARMLLEIFSKIGATYLRPGLLTGQVSKGGDEHISLQKQVQIMAKFRNGEVNCLFATSVAEEGLDIPDCNLVIRFDLYKSVIQYVQSKGRARHKNSKFVDMIEHGNQLHQSMRTLVRHQELKLRQWIEALDPERRLTGNDDGLKGIERLGRYFIHPKSQAKLTYWSALEVLSLFASTLQTEDIDAITEPSYVVSAESGGYFCEVVMPKHSPIHSAFGLRYPRKALAKRSAAFEMCIKLLKGNFLDSNLLPKSRKIRPGDANSRLAVNKNNPGKYKMQLKPSLWAAGRGSIPEVVHLLIIDMLEGLERPHRPLGLLTRNPLDDFPSFPLFLNTYQISHVKTISKPGFRVNDEEITTFTKYSLLLWNHVNAKVFENSPSKMSYWIVPILKKWTTVSNSRDCIDWEEMESAILGRFQQWTPGMPVELIENKFIVDRWAGNRRYFSHRVEPRLKPLDEIPDQTAEFKGHGSCIRQNILQYSVSLYGKKFDEAWPKWDKTQPVMECTKLTYRQNFLAPPTKREEDDATKRNKKTYLCPEPLIISALSSDVVTTFLVFPAIIHRIEDYLIALEAANLIGIDVGPALALEAMTKDSENSEDLDTEDKSNFRPGMGNNYERLEFMGDCFLKTATSISLYASRPHHDEFDLHVSRMHMICNQNLMNSALEFQLTAYVRSMAFSRRLWYPEAIELVAGKGAGCTKNTDNFKHSLSNKTIADICEALIGAAFVQHNNPNQWLPHTWNDAVRAVSKLVRNPNHTAQTWAEYKELYEPPGWQIAEATAPQRDLQERIARQMGYNFRWPRLLRSAFSHPSMPHIWERVPCYQRLEFLGDALLDLVCIMYLFYNYPNKNPQWLTEHKMAMVSNKFLGALCVKLGFHRYVRHSSPSLGMHIKAYVEEVELAENSPSEKGGLDYWLHVKDPPKCLPDVVEAYIGALFIDSGFNFSEVQSFFDIHIKPFFVNVAIYDSFAHDHPVTLLHHNLSQVYGCQAYQILCKHVESSIANGKSKVMAGLIVHREIVATAVGESGRYAKERASSQANHELQGLTVKEFKRKFGCNCKSPSIGEMAKEKPWSMSLTERKKMYNHHSLAVL